MTRSQLYFTHVLVFQREFSKITQYFVVISVPMGSHKKGEKFAFIVPLVPLETTL